MKRRNFLALVAGLAACPLVARAQRPTKRPLIAVLTRWEERLSVSYFVENLRKRRDGLNIRVEVRSADGDAARLPALASELIELKPDVMVTAGGVLAYKALTVTTPIVELYLFDPVELGLIASLARPGGNVTGIISQFERLPGKQLQFLKLLRPNLSRLGLMITLGEIGELGSRRRKDYEAAATSMGVTVVPVEVRTHEDFDGAFQALVEAKVEALVETPASALVFTQRHDYASRALAARLPTISNARAVVEAGGLMSYARNPRGTWGQAIDFVNRILEGATPGNLPVEMPTRFELAINLKTANALNLEVPPNLLALADVVIE
jgi:putative ABC transport system substrate-binding protein